MIFYGIFLWMNIADGDIVLKFSIIQVPDSVIKTSMG